MRVSLWLVGAAASALLLALLAVAPAAGISSGQLGSCDMTPVMASGNRMWYNGCIGKDNWNNNCIIGGSDNPMPWVRWSQPDPAYTLRSGDVGLNRSVDVQSYTPGGALNEIHLRTLKIDRRWIGMLMYATNGTAGTAKKETQVGSWRVLPAASAGFQVPPNCPNAVTHNGAEVKPMHVRLWFAAPVGTGTVRFRILLKEGVQGRGNFWFPSRELVLTEGKAPPPPPQNSPAVWGMQMVNGSMVNSIIQPAVIVPLAPLSSEEKAPIVAQLGQACAEACAQQLPATPFCHKKATAGISSSQALLSAIGKKAECSLPILAGCPLAGAARITRSETRVSCSFRSTDAASTCPSWAVSPTSPLANAASLFASGSTSSTDRSSPLYVPDVCFTAPTADSQNVCVCTNIKAQQGPNPFVAAAIAALKVKPSKTSAQSKKIGSTSAAAGRTSPAVLGLFVALLSGVFGLSSSRLGSSKLVLLVLAAVALLSLSSSPVFAHNYMRGLHRASEASVTKPCQTKIGNDPHVQIVAGQTFEMEFTNGHGNAEGQRKTYFVILPAASYDELKARNITDILRAYLNEAPASAFRSSKPDAKMWERQHRRRVGENAIGPAEYWEDPKGLNASDPLFIKVDPVYDEKTHPNAYGGGAKVVQTRVHPSLFAAYGNDRRAVYTNTKWPWIESVDEFINPYNRENNSPVDFFSHQGDIARFNFPANKGPGDYIAWYSWSGYGDCVDINVMPGTKDVEYKYGRNATELGGKQYAIKVDHCEIRNIPLARTMMRVVDPVTHDASQCVNDCLALGWNQCSAVQVVRYTNPTDTLQRLPNIPWIHFHWNQTGWDKGPNQWPCRCDTVFECVERGCRRTSVEQAAYEGWKLGGQDRINELNMANANTNITNYPNLKDSDYFCFGVKPGRNQDNQVDEDWILADDPSDPVWYSTCYLTATRGGYLEVAPLEMTPLDFVTSERCVSCDWHEQASAFVLNQVPMWDRGLQPVNADKCTDCSLRASAPPPGVDRAAQLSALTGSDRMFVGYDAAAEQAEYDEAVKAAAAAQPAGPGEEPVTGGDGDGESSSSDSLIFGLGKVPSILVLVGIGLGGLLLLGGVAFAIHSLRSSRRSSNSDLRRMQEAGGVGSTELQANPAFQRL